MLNVQSQSSNYGFRIASKKLLTCLWRYGGCKIICIGEYNRKKHNYWETDTGLPMFSKGLKWMLKLN